jgi:hypothetical protein
MIQARALESTADLCCLPSPYRIPQGVAGMAFNFSKIEVPQAKGPLEANPNDKSPAPATRV